MGSSVADLQKLHERKVCSQDWKGYPSAIGIGPDQSAVNACTAWEICLGANDLRQHKGNEGGKAGAKDLEQKTTSYLVSECDKDKKATTYPAELPAPKSSAGKFSKTILPAELLTIYKASSRPPVAWTIFDNLRDSGDVGPDNRAKARAECRVCATDESGAPWIRRLCETVGAYMDGGKKCYIFYAAPADQQKDPYKKALKLLVDKNGFDPRVSTSPGAQRTVEDWHFDNSPNFRGFHRLRSLHLWSSYSNVRTVAQHLTAASIPEGRMQEIFPNRRQVQTENVHISSHKVWIDKMAYGPEESRQQLPDKFHMTIGKVLPEFDTSSAFLQPSGGAFFQSRSALVSADHVEDEQHGRDSGAEDVDDDMKSTIFSTTSKSKKTLSRSSRSSSEQLSSTSTTSEDAAAPVRPPNNTTSSSSTTTRRNTPTTTSSATRASSASRSTANNFNYIEFEKAKEMSALYKNVAVQGARMYKKRGFGSVESQDVGAADQLVNIEDSHDVGDEVDESGSSSVHLYNIKNSPRFSRLESTAQHQQRSRVYHDDVDDTGSTAASKDSGGDGGDHHDDEDDDDEDDDGHDHNRSSSSRSSSRGATAGTTTADLIDGHGAGVGNGHQDDASARR
ncbi:unnamed protein product [Amoebophrya sp. A25]|nr:unnamed protein product [Amoebophrya sp. A25]|eukprot:GSA25T00019519001.1